MNLIDNLAHNLANRLLYCFVASIRFLSVVFAFFLMLAISPVSLSVMVCGGTLNIIISRKPIFNIFFIKRSYLLMLSRISSLMLVDLFFALRKIKNPQSISPSIMQIVARFGVYRSSLLNIDSEFDEELGFARPKTVAPVTVTHLSLA